MSEDLTADHVRAIIKRAALGEGETVPKWLVYVNRSCPPLTGLTTDMSDADVMEYLRDYKAEESGGGPAGAGVAPGVGAGGAVLADTVLLSLAQTAQSMHVTASRMEASVQPVEVSVSGCSSWKANATLAACQIYTGPTTSFPCCLRNLQPPPPTSIPRMEWVDDKEDSNLPQAVAVLQAWCGDAERFVVVDVHSPKWLSMERGIARVKEGKTDLLVLDKVLAKRLLRNERGAYATLVNGTADRTTIMQVAQAIVLVYECKTTSALASRGGVLGCRSQCKVEFALINVLCGWHELGWEDGAEATAWLGDVNLDQALALHTVPGYAAGTRTLHIMGTNSTVSPAVVLAAFRETLRATMTARSKGQRFPALPAPPAPPAAAPPDQGGAGGHRPPPAAEPRDGGGAAGGHPLPAAAASSGPEAGVSHAPMQTDEMVHTASVDCSLAACSHNSAAQLVLSPWTGGTSAGSSSSSSSSGTADATDVPTNYHEMVDFNADRQERLAQVLSHPSMLNDLGVTPAELATRVAGLDAWGYLTEVYRKLAMALPPEGVGSASEGPGL